MSRLDLVQPSDTFVRRHIGPSEADLPHMLGTVGVASLQELVAQTVPQGIRLGRALALEPERAESTVLAELATIAAKNEVLRSFIGLGYYETMLPAVVQRNILENPGWYTQYTPYQAEISQGRMEALVNFQTMVADLTGLPLANASLLDEGTAAAEAMSMALGATKRERTVLVVDPQVLPQTIAVLQTRAEPLGIEVRVTDPTTADTADAFAVLLQYPGADGVVRDFRAVASRFREAGAVVIAATDLLALTLLTPPGEWGAEIAIGSAQRFGVPMGFGGPHAAFLATQDTYARQLPGRLIGVSRDATGRPAYRLTLQTREQHIRRDRATSNICTAQVLLAVLAGMYAVYHGPTGLQQIATRVRLLTGALSEGLRRMAASTPGLVVPTTSQFDTIVLGVADADAVHARAVAAGVNLRAIDAKHVGVSLDERTSIAEVEQLWAIVAGVSPEFGVGDVLDAVAELPNELARTSEYLTHPTFHRSQSEHEMLRYIHRLQGRDLSLTSSMIPLGSCTMKLNATSEMLPITWPAFSSMHPFAPASQTAGYRELFDTLESWLSEITGFAATSLQPNSGAQGEYAGLLVIRAWHLAQGNGHRRICLIPVSAHGTNPASAVMAGMQVVPVKCDVQGNIDLEDLRARAVEHSANLAALMITYPSTHGVFEEGVAEACRIVHTHGGQVYMDGANMNAQVGLCRPGDIGADVCHLNLHKTFCIPHGGGGPGVGPICVAAHLAPFLPGHPLVKTGGEHAIGPVSAAPWGSASILPISWMYIRMMGAAGLQRATEIAILNANYMAARLQEHFTLVYTGQHGRVAHEFILDMRPFKASAGIEAEDVAKRLMDYGFHAPTMSWPVPGTLMVEPTESESLSELDRFCDAMIRIREEIRQIEAGTWPRDTNPLKLAPHPAHVVLSDAWDRPYTREQAAFPAPWVRGAKFWPSVSRVDNTWGDRNLFCSCPPIEDFEAAE